MSQNRKLQNPTKQKFECPSAWCEHQYQKIE